MTPLDENLAPAVDKMAPYRYENSPVHEMAAAEAAAESGSLLDRFFNVADPQMAVLHEQPWHRMALWMKVQGASNKVIAKHVGKTPEWIGQLTRQPWARTRMLEMMNECGVDEVQTILKGAVADSIYKLIELRDDEEVPAAVKRGCATDIIHQFLGKPRQQVEHTAGTGMEHISDEELKTLVVTTETAG